MNIFYGFCIMAIGCVAIILNKSKDTNKKANSIINLGVSLTSILIEFRVELVIIHTIITLVIVILALTGNIKCLSVITKKENEYKISIIFLILTFVIKIIN
ncbi:hypothetical protein ACSXAI_07060 [Clostridium perfringens]